MTTSSGTSTRTQARTAGGLPARFARRGAPAPGEPVPSPARTSPAGRTARTRLNADDARCEALFASALQRSAAPAAESVAAAISRAVRRLGTRGCVSRMAQESGDHPQAAAERMRWVRQLAAAAAAPATCEPGPEAAWPIPGARRPPGHDSASGVSARVAGSPATTADQRNQHGRKRKERDTVRQIQVQRRPPRRADSEPPRAEYHDPAIRRARQATARAARKTR